MIQLLDLSCSNITMNSLIFIKQPGFLKLEVRNFRLSGLVYSPAAGGPPVIFFCTKFKPLQANFLKTAHDPDMLPAVDEQPIYHS